MARIHTIPLHLGDLITDTTHLSPAELGAYIRLIAAHYRIGDCGLPDDECQLRRITGLDNKSWNLSRNTILNFFEMNGDRRWVHGRVQKTLFGIAQKQEQNRDKALKRWNSHHATASIRHCHGNATAMQSIIHNPKAISKSKSINSYSADFENLWQEYPRKDCSKSDAFKAYNRIIKDGESNGRIIEGLKKFREYVNREGIANQYIPHASTWLNQRRWEADYSDVRKSTIAPSVGKLRPNGNDPASTAFNIGESIIAKRRAEREAVAGVADQGIL